MSKKNGSQRQSYSLAVLVIVLMSIGLILIQAVFFAIAVSQRSSDIRQVAIYDASRTAISIYNTFYPLAPQARKQLAETLVYINYDVAISDGPGFIQDESSDSLLLTQRINRIIDYTDELNGITFSSRPQVVTAVDNIQITLVLGDLSWGDRVFDATAALSFPEGDWLRIDYKSMLLVENDLLELLWQSLAQLVLQFLLAILVLRLVLRPLQDLAGFARRIDPENPQQDIKNIPKFGPLEVTQISEAFRDLLQRNKDFIDQRFRILASLSHDLRTPIHRLRMQLENEPDLKYPEDMQNSLRELQTMAERAIDMARTGKDAELFQKVDLAWFLDNIVSEYQEAHPDFSGRISLESEQNVIASLKPDSFNRCLQNLLDNALRYGQQADIAMRAAAEQITITIQDRGPGIPEHLLDAAFEPFFRVDYSRNKSTGGSGLGLSIARDLAKANGGRLCLKNAEEGGLLAIVTLPR